MEPAVVAMIVQVTSLVGGGIWIVAMLRSRLDSLVSNLKSLAESIVELKQELRTLDDRLDSQEKQLIRLEVREEVVEELRRKAEIAEELHRKANHGNHR